MTAEANRSVALSSPSRGEDEEDLDEDGNRSNLVVRLPSPGMGSEDQKLGGESVSCYGRNGYLDSEGFEAQQLFELVTDGEAEEVKFGAESFNCEITDDGSNADVGGDCSGLFSGTRKGEEEEQRGVSGCEVENGPLEFQLGGEVGVPTSKLLDSSTEVNGGVGDKISKLEIFRDGASVGNGNSHAESVIRSSGSEEECQGAEEGNVDLGVKQSLNVSVSNKEFGLRDLKQAPEKGDADNQTEVEVADNEGSCDSMNAPGGMISGKREDVEQFWGDLDEARVSDVVRDRREKHDDLPSLLQSTMSEGDYLNDGDGAQTLEVEVTSNVAYVNSGRRSGDLDSWGKEAQEESQALLGAQGEIGHLGLEKTLVVEASKPITEEEHDEFNGLLPLRILGEGDLGCSSVFGTGLEERFGFEMFESNQVRNVCEAAALVVCSGLASDPSLVKMNKDAVKTMNGPCCPENASQDFEGNSMEDKTDTSLCIEAEKVNRGRFSGIKFCPNGEIRKENQFTLETRQRLPLQSAGSQKEHSHFKDNSNRLSAGAIIYPPEIVRHRCPASYVEKDDFSLQGPSEEVARNSGFTSVDLLHLASSFEAFSQKLYMPQDFQGSQAITVNRIPLCSNNNNCSPVEAYNEGKVDTQSVPEIVCRRSNPKRAATLRDNLAEGKINQLSRIQDSRRKGKKPVDITSPPLLSLIQISDKLKRKRSYPGRPPRASAWGPLENLAKAFEQNGKHATFIANKVHNQNRRLKRGRSDVDSKRRVDPRKNGNIPALSANHNASSNQSMSHIMLGLDAADCMPSSDCQVDFGKFNKAETRHKLIVDRSVVGLKSLQQDAQLGDKDIESSLTQEASAELGECAGVSSQIGPQVQVETASDRNLLDPGTSPDSVVYHPGIDVGLMTSEGASSADPLGIGIIDVGAMGNEGVTSANLISKSGRSVLDPEPVSEDGLHHGVSASSRSVIISLSVQAVDRNARAGYEKWETNGEVNTQACGVPEDLSVLDKFHASEILNKNRQSSNCKQKIQGTPRENSKVSSKACKNTTRIGSKCKNFPELSVSDQADLGVVRESMKSPAGLEKWVLPGEDTGNSQSVLSVLCDKSKTHKLTRSRKSGRSKERSNFREAAEQKRENTHGEMGKNLQKADNKCSTEMRTQILDASLDASIGMSFFSGTVNPTSILPTQVICEAGSTVVPGDVSSLSMISVSDQLAPNESYSLEQFLLPQVAWVLCDDCGKWRCISVELANALEESNCKWTCKDNMDKAFADCSIPQEKTNAEINAELGIPDEDDPSSGKASANAAEPYKLSGSQRSSWISIKSNVFLHRTRKNQTIDEIMVCHCKTPRDGRLGCGEQCLNRILNIECVKGTCPCGDLCSNQQFQKRKYVKFKSFRSGKKGYGLQLQENVAEGQFLIEYVGEVLDFAAYEARQRYYAARGQKHFYFMTLNGGEVIDACAKGNLGRYINHSCEPNCRTEKWMVNGEVCIGLFAIRDIKKGEEVTFDYNYVRVGGAAVKKCVCGSSECRGYIGGDPLNSEVIVQGDSDEDDYEPVMTHGSGQRGLNAFEPVSSRNTTKVAKHEDISAERQDMVVNCPLPIPEPENCVKEEDTYETKLEDCVEVEDMYKSVPAGHVRMEDMYKPVPEDCVKVEDMHEPIPESDSIASSVQTLDFTKSENTDTQPLGDPNQKLNHVLAAENICKPIPDSQPTELSLQSSTIVSEVVCYPVTSNKKSATNKVEEKANAAKSNSPTKFSHLKSIIKKGRSGMKSLEPQKPKTVVPGTNSGHFEGVEGKLNELLDVNGGISKQKDAARGYLKLLFVTAAEGDGGGCASRSSRELSLILDAILKTKSRKVLMDIINKNGLQMLHNILKQNRDNFNRIPIIRKLLKVLEFLALTGILTIEHINRDPPCSGIESFKESMLKLANHNDKLVHKIARDFRDKWIPRNIKRVEPSDRRDGGHSDWQHPCRSWIQSSNASNWPAQAARDTDAIVITAADHLPSVSSDELNIPGETSHSQELPNPTPGTDDSSPSGTKARKRKSRWDTPSDCTGQEQQSFLCIEDQNVEGGLKFLKCTSSPSEQRTAWLEDPMLLEDEGPPGFEVSEKDHLSQVSSEVAVVMGHPQEIYLSDLPTSFGIPVALMKQLGTPETSGSTSWAIAPGVPFHPFPPLPCYPREQPNPREQRHPIRSAVIPSTSDMVDARCRNSQFNGRVRWNSDGRGRRFQFKHPKRWDNQRFERCRPTGPYQRVGRGFRGGLRDGHPNSVVGGNVMDAKWGFCPPDGVNNNDDVALSGYRQQQNW